jgi:hypothetical protein
MNICPIKAWISSYLVCNISHFDIYIHICVCVCVCVCVIFMCVCVCVFNFYGPLHVHGSLIVTLLIYVKQIKRSAGY